MMINQVMKYYQFPLLRPLTINQKNKLSLRLYTVKNVVFTKYYPNAVRVFYKNSVDKSLIIQILGYKTQVNVPVNIKNRLNTNIIAKKNKDIN